MLPGNGLYQRLLDCTDEDEDDAAEIEIEICSCSWDKFISTTMARPAILEAQKFPAHDLLPVPGTLRPNRLGFDELPTPPAPSSAIPSAAETTARHLQQLKPAFPSLRPPEPSPPQAARFGQMAAPVGDAGQVRIINGHEIVFGERSKSDAKSWPCEGCRATNHPRRMLIFDIPRFRCHGCGRPFQGDFDMCFANVRVNGIPILGDLKCQKPYEDECIAYALAYLCEMIYKIDCALNSEDPDIEVVKSIRMKPSILYTPFNKMFDGLEIPAPGIHKLLRLCQKLRQQGALFELHQKKAAKQNSFSFQMGENQIVHSFDFEEVCEQIADGNPLIATLTTGSDYPDLKFCEFYTGVPTLEFNIQLARKRTVASHVVLLIGAASIGGNRGFYGLDAQGNVFCPQFAQDESWTVASRLAESSTAPCVAESSTAPSVAESSTAPPLKKQKREPVCAGFGKINAKTEFRMNFIKFARRGEEGSYVENFKLLDEDESSTTVSEENMNLVYDGEYFDKLSIEVGRKLRERGLISD